MRLFAALPLPPDAVEQLTRLRLRLSAPKDGLRWSEPEQWHITLQFYGEVDQYCAECLKLALAGLAVPAPSLALRELGLFATKGILYGALEPSDALQTLQAEVLRRSQSCGILPESRPFHPHITLARSKSKAGFLTLKRFSLPALPSLGVPVRWTADELLLIESILRPQGAQYTVLARLSLRGTGHQGSGE